MNIEMSDGTKMAILKDFFDSIEDGLYDELRAQGGGQKDVKVNVKIGEVLVGAVWPDGDVFDIKAHFSIRYIQINMFINHIQSTPKSEIYVVRKEKPLSLETLDERVKKLESKADA